MNTQQNAISQNVPAVISDGFDFDPTESPLKGVAFRFNEGTYESYSDAIDVKGKSYAVIKRTKGWQKLERGCPPEYLIKAPGEPLPLQPQVLKEDWPLDLNGQPAHPWKLTHYIYLLETTAGEFSTFWTNTVGGNYAVGELKDQVELMRQLNPNAMPVVALEAKDMPTKFGGTKPRPYFRILGWKAHGSEQTLLGGPEQKLIDVEKPASEEIMGEKGWDAKGDPLPADLGAKKKKKTGNE